MVIKIARYLSQQGYKTDRIVILVPYQSQLRDIRDALLDENEPIVNDLDDYGLVRAGVPPASTTSKKPIHLATIGIIFAIMSFVCH